VTAKPMFYCDERTYVMIKHKYYNFKTVG